MDDLVGGGAPPVVRGRVLDPAGRPVTEGYGYVVAVCGMDVVRSPVDAHGRFEVPRPAGDVVVGAVVPGFEVVSRRESAEADAPLDVELRLSAARTIEGVVVDARGAPVADLPMVFTDRGWGSGTPVEWDGIAREALGGGGGARQFAEVRSDAAGEFRVQGEWTDTVENRLTVLSASRGWLIDPPDRRAPPGPLRLVARRARWIEVRLSDEATGNEADGVALVVHAASISWAFGGAPGRSVLAWAAEGTGSGALAISVRAGGEVYEPRTLDAVLPAGEEGTSVDVRLRRYEPTEYGHLLLEWVGATEEERGMSFLLAETTSKEGATTSFGVEAERMEDGRMRTRLSARRHRLALHFVDRDLRSSPPVWEGDVDVVAGVETVCRCVLAPHGTIVLRTQPAGHVMLVGEREGRRSSWTIFARGAETRVPFVPAGDWKFSTLAAPDSATSVRIVAGAETVLDLGRR